jgi:hypothetical protein
MESQKAAQTYPIMAMPFCLVLGVDTSVMMAVARLTLPLASPPKNLAKTKIAKVDAKHLKSVMYKINSRRSSSQFEQIEIYC